MSKSNARRRMLGRARALAPSQSPAQLARRIRALEEALAAEHELLSHLDSVVMLAPVLAETEVRSALRRGKRMLASRGAA